MYYLELIHRFWEFNKIVKIGATEISLYLYLLKIGYDNQGYDFKISDSDLGRDLGFSRVTIKYTKEKLQDLGLIQFRAAKGLPSYYRLLLDYPFHSESKKEMVQANTTNEKLHKPKALEIFPKIESQNSENINIPSFHEFLNYATTLENYKPHLNAGIKEKYESWINKEWRNVSNRPISNWKSTLKSILPYMKISTDEDYLSVNHIPSIKRPEMKNMNELNQVSKNNDK